MGEKRVIEQVASNEVHNDDWFLKDSPTQDTSKISATNLKAILGADGTLALEEIANAIAEEYDSTHTYYNTGLVFHEGVLYQCTATSTTGTWDSTKWNVVDIKDLLDNVSTNIGYLWNTISNTIAGIYDTSSTYNTGDYAIYSLKLYRCKDDGVTGAWNSSKWEEVNIPEYIDYVLVNAGKVDDVKVDGTSVVTNKVAEIEIPVKDVKVDGTSVVNASGVAEITLPDVPVQDVQVKTDSTYDSVVDASGNAKIDLSSVTAYGEVPNLPQAIATFKDGADAPMKSLKVAIEPQQDLHGYDSPWVGGAGKNKFDIDSPHEAVSGSATYIYTVRVKPNTAYTMSSNVPQDNIASLYFNGGATNVNGVWNGTPRTFTSDENGNLVAYVRYDDAQGGIDLYTAVKNGQYYIQLEEGSTATTFAPYSNICPISGWSAVDVSVCGKNLYSATLADYSSTQVVGVGLATFYPIKVPYGTYTISTNAPTGYIWAGYNIDDSSTLPRVYEGNPNTVTTDIIWVGLLTADMSSAYAYNIMINQGSTPSSYEPYNGHTYTIPFVDSQGNPVEVYGGSVDVVNGGEQPSRLGSVDLGTLSWNKYGDDKFYTTINDLKAPITTDDRNKGMICDRYKPSLGLAINDMNDKSYLKFNQTENFWICDSNYTDATASDFKQAMNGVQLVYELATPTTFYTQPTAVKSVEGQNNVYANTGDINECVYRRDMSSTIDDIIARLEALENA